MRLSAVTCAGLCKGAACLQTDCYGLLTHTTWWENAWEWSPHEHGPNEVNVELVKQCAHCRRALPLIVRQLMLLARGSGYV